MGSSNQLYHRIVGKMASLILCEDIRHLKNLIWIIVGIVQQKSVALSKIAQSIPGETKAESRIAQIRRWLMNSRIDIWTLYQPMLEQVLKQWQDLELTVIVDGVMVFGDRLQIFRLSFVHGCRAIPICWKVVAGKGLTTVDVLEPMLNNAAEFLRHRVGSVTLLADRGFRDIDWAELCLRLGWHYDIRIAANTTIWLAEGKICGVDELGIKPGKARFYQQAAVTLEGEFETNLSVTWAKDESELLAIISDRPANRTRLKEYRLRMQIEESFRDDQSSGFDLEHTRLHHPERLERLLLAEAIATIWCHELGELCILAGDEVRRIVDSAWKRELSIFQIGLRWLHRCLATGLDLLPNFYACLSPIKLKPVIKNAS